MSISRKVVVFLLSILLVGCFTLPVMAAVPSKISYQGRLTDASGMLVANGDYEMTFFLWDDEIDGRQHSTALCLKYNLQHLGNSIPSI
jgi:hypothetical protein